MSFKLIKDNVQLYDTVLFLKFALKPTKAVRVTVAVTVSAAKGQARGCGKSAPGLEAPYGETTGSVC